MSDGQRTGRFLPLLAGALLIMMGHAPIAAADTGTGPGVSLGDILPGLGETARQFKFFNATQPGGTAQSADLPAQRTGIADQAKRALDAKHWSLAATLYRQRLGLGDTDRADLWLAYATALSHAAQPNARTIEAAAYIAWQQSRVNDDATAKSALGLIAHALDIQGNEIARMDLLAAMQHVYPDDKSITASLVAATKLYGVHVQKLTVQENQFPTSACLTLTTSPSDATDFHPGDWVTLKPSVPGAAVTMQSGQICIAGMPAGNTTTVVLKRGMPLVSGVVLPVDTSIPVVIPNRSAQLIADSSHYLIPASASPSIGVATVNLDKVKLKVVRVAERSLNGFFANHPLFNPNNNQGSLNGNYGRTVWQGTAAIPGFVPNKLIHAVLPLSKLMSKPGLYAVDISPGPGQPNASELETVQLVLRTDLAPIVWSGWNGMHVQIRSFTDAKPKPDVSVALIASDNSILATATTDKNGFAHFAEPLLDGAGGQAPAALHITGPDGDFTVLDLSASPLDLSDRGISGRPVANRIDPFLWLDRGIYRPGETVNVAALYRTDTITPIDLPLHVIIRRPAGQVFLDKVVPRTDDDSITLPVKLPGAAQAGNWTVSLAMGVDKPALAQREFTVAAFVPAKLKVTLGPKKLLAAGKLDHLPVNVRFLYGAPGSKLTGTATLRLQTNDSPFPDWKDYSFGLGGEIFESPLNSINLDETGPQGNTSVPIDLTAMPDSTHALEASVNVSINDPSGRAVTAATTLPITPAAPLLGIKEGFADGTVGDKVAPSFQLAAVDPAGKAVAMKVDVSLVRQETEWHIYLSGGVARWAITQINRPVETKTITLDAGKPTAFTAPTLDWGRYRLRVVQSGGGFAASSVVFYAGWATSANPAVPQRVTVSSDQKAYAPGAIAHVHVTAPFAGPATLVVANNGVLSTRNFMLPAGGTTLNVPIGDNWGAGAYAMVEAFRTSNATQTPDRAVGLTWLGVKPGPRNIDVTIPVDPIYRPGGDLTFKIHAAPGAYVTLAAVDEGILSLTNFASPDPIGHFFGQRQLGVSLLDDYGALILPPTGQSALLKNGAGANFGPANKPIPQTIVSLFAGPVQAGPDGVASITLHMPQFNGQVRLMAVAWTKTAVGAAHQDIIVRNRVIANALLPRFLAPGDTADAGLMLQNLDLPDGVFTASLTAIGPLSIKGATNGTLTLPATDLKPNDRSVLRFELDAANAEGTGRIDLALNGPDYSLKRHWIMTVHSARAAVSRLASAEVKPGASQTIGLNDAGLYPGSIAATITFGNTLPFDPAEYMQALAADKLPFLSQSVSRGLPLTVLHGAVAGPEPAARLARAVEQVLDLQRFDGSFGLWSSHDFSEPWLSAYATEFLLRARKAGAYVPGVQIDQALTWLHNEVVQGNNADFAQVYGAYVLGLAGQPPAGAIRQLDQNEAGFHMPLTRAQLGAALDDIGEPGRASAILKSALAIHNRLTGDWYYFDRDWNGAFGSPLRDAWAVPAVIAQTGLLRDRLPELHANLPGKGIEIDTLNAQELAWACFADGVFGAPPPPMNFTINGSSIKATKAVSRALTAPAAIDNDATTSLAVSVATTGIPAQPPAAASQGMSVQRHFYTMDGDDLDPTTLAQNTSFIMLISGRADDSAPHRAVVDAGLPAGWELAGSISSGKTEQRPWLGDLSEPRIRAASDDRYEAAFDLAPSNSSFFDNDNGTDREFRVAVMLRAVTPGHFTLPGVTLSDMFHPMVFARSTGGNVTVLAPGQKPPPPKKVDQLTAFHNADAALRAEYSHLMKSLPAGAKMLLMSGESQWVKAKRATCGTQKEAEKTSKGVACLLDQTRSRLKVLKESDPDQGE